MMRWACAALAIAAISGSARAAPTARDGSHDFDFNIGKWHTQISRRVHPLSDDPTRASLDGTVTVRPVWGGRAQLEEIETDGPAGHWQGMTLFLYDPTAHQWSQSFADSTDGRMSSTIGSFENGVGTLYAYDTIGGRHIMIRGVWSAIKPDTHDYTESYSVDGGQTWEPEFVAHLTRIAS